MNQISEVVATLIHYNVAVRDTLEYTIKKEKYEVELFQAKKKAILIEVNESTPLKKIIESSGDNGKALDKQIRDFYDQIYGDDSTVLKLGVDGLRVDAAQHLAIFTQVVPIREHIEDMINGILNDAHGNNADVAQVEAVVLADEKLERGVAYMTLVDELIKLFNDYNLSRNEAKGAETASSRFIGHDISTVISLIEFQKAHSHVTDNEYWVMQDKVMALVEMMTGRRPLPTGKKFPDVMKEVQDLTRLYIRDVEPNFRSLYTPMIEELVEQAKADAEKAKLAPAAGEKTAPAAPAKEAAEDAVAADFAEIDPKTGMPKA